VNAALQDAALKAHKAVGARGYSRSDFIVTDTGVVFLEINTLPGLTKASLYPKALAAQGVGFVEFLKGQIALAEGRAAETP
jgi:D-alanine-D-alanine ligase